MKKNKIIICLILVLTLTQAFYTPPCCALDSETKDTEKIVITAEEIEKMNVTDIVDLLNRFPGIEAGESSARIHGSYDVKVLLDGRPLNDPLASYSKVKWNMVSLHYVDKIEIYKGMGAVAFGDSTSGGVICITSKEINGKQAKIKTEWGNLKTQQHSFNASLQAGIFGLGVSTEYYRTDGYRTNQDRDSKHMGIRTAYLPRNGPSGSISFDYTDEQRGNAGYPSYPTPHAREKSKSFATSLMMNADALTSNTYFGSYEQISEDPDKCLYSQSEGWSAGEDLSYRFTQGHLKDIAAGLSFRTDYIKGSYFDSYHEESYGLSFAKSTAFSSIPLICSFGLRANLYSAFKTVVNPEIKLSYDLKGTRFQVSAAKTNNVPPVLKRFYESSSTRANPFLGMEKASNISASAAIPCGNTMETGITFFYNEIADKIVYVRDAVGSQGMYRNFGKVTRKGAIMTINWKPAQWLNIKPSYEYLAAKDENTGLTLSGSPEHRAQFEIQYKPVSAFTATIIYEYTSKQYTRSDNTEQADPYNTVELKADYSFGKWRIFGRIKNLTDKSYLYGEGLPAPPRTWLIGMSKDF